MRRTIVSAAFLFAFVPAIVSAQSVTTLQQQIQALLSQIQTLQGQIGTNGQSNSVISTNGTVINPQTGIGIPISGMAGVNSGSCPNIGRVLKAGSSGDDVTKLQQFLALDTAVYPEGVVSGYFGSLTQTAVQRWQTKYNIVSNGTPATTGFGVVGPRTAAAIALLCSTGKTAGGTTGAVGGFIQVSPTAGNAPLAVNVQATVNTTSSQTISLLGGTNPYITSTGEMVRPLSPFRSLQIRAPKVLSRFHIYTKAEETI